MNEDLPLNQYHIKASNNTFGIKFFWDNIQNINYVKKFLDEGYRGLEIDVYQDRKKGTKVAHHGLNLSFSRPTFRQYLNKIQKWRVENPTHLPLIIHLQANDPSKYQGLAENIFSEVLDVFKNGVILTPDEVTLFRTANPEKYWPLLRELRGRIIFNTQTETHTAFHKQNVDGSVDISKYFFTTANSDFFANYSFQKLKWNSKVNVQNIEKLRNDVENGKLIRVYPAYKFVFIFRRKVLDVQDCINWGVNLIAVDKVKNIKSSLLDPYTSVNKISGFHL